MSTFVTLSRSCNQALGLGEFAIDFLAGRLGPGPSEAVRQRTRDFHHDATLCGLSAVALGTNAPTVLRAEAMEYADPRGARLLGTETRVKPEKAIVANGAAVREWDSNGTNFGYRPALGHTAGEFGHNDFYGVAVAAAEVAGRSDEDALLGMILIDEIRGRLAEVFSLKTYKIDHVVHGAIASAVTYAAMLGGTAEQIESAVGMFVAHHIPWRAIRAGKQLSDSKGASAAISTEAAVLCAQRALRGFVGPKDIFRNPESVFRQFVRTDGDSPFDLVLSHSGDDFAVMGMHFKLGLYEHQSASAIHGLLQLLTEHPELREPGAIQRILIRAYEPAFGIIGDPAKRNPTTRQSADHSMVYIVARLLRNARRSSAATFADLWDETMLMPGDYADEAIFDSETREIMELIAFEHGGAAYDAAYPEGIPTSLHLDTVRGAVETPMILFPVGHARNDGEHLSRLLAAKWARLGALAGV
ncbi:MAG: MmgE/PrpD family protein [Fimbriimonadaceae bacterium]|nr:MmgE/PrpD family protein [Fimbriimonadaceae bacterium]